MKIIEMHSYTKRGGVWYEDSYTSENQLSREEMAEDYASVMTWKYIHRSPLWNLPSKTETDYATGNHTITFLARCDVGGPAIYKRVYVTK